MTGPEPIPHAVESETRADGTILLRSALKLGPVARNTGAWLHRWAAETPDAVFIAERDGPGWRAVSYAQMLTRVRRMAAGLLRAGIGPGEAIVVLSGPSIDHAVLSLAAQYIGVLTVPLAEQYSLIRQAHDRLRHCAGAVRPAAVFAADGQRFAEALALDVFAGVRRIVSRNAGPGMTLLADLDAEPDAALDDAHARVGPDTVAKILFTSGSTSEPKGVPQTQAMMCVNQAQYLACLPILGAKRHVLLDWLPWNHVFAGNSNFNMMLSNGGALYLDDGKPVGPLAARSLENFRLVQATLRFDVPVAHALQVAALKADPDLRRRYFAALDIFFYAGASLPADIWAAIEEMSLAETGERPFMISSWGMTETAPSAIIYHEKGAGPGMIGVPVPGLEAKLIPLGEGRYELRVRGPNLFGGYLGDAGGSAESFDAEGFFITGDAVRLVDPADFSRGLIFDGRLGEDFKLITGTWVHASTLRLKALAALAGLVQDVVVVGEGRAEVGLLIFPPPGQTGHRSRGAIVDETTAAALELALARLAETATGSSNRIARALILAEPPDIGAGEITAKGSLNTAAITRRRAALVDRLYDDADPAVIRI
ncbi:MAG: feruloyl-CoA synthetase [Alphaproteobacteria bacterium]|nr:MAG: feruloyl-CoA synthetase [Alphaproteobacteria bacterium]